MIDYAPDIILSRESGRITDTVRTVVTKRLGKQIYFQPSQIDQYRLLILRTWSQRYKLDVEVILDVLLNVWMNKFKPKSSGGLGVSIRTLCGKKSKEILADWVRRTYPSNENITAWKEKVRFQYTLDGSSPEFFDVQTYVQDYLVSIRRKRRKAALKSSALARRPFRENPFR